MVTLARPDVGTIWDWLRSVPDPEIPALNLVDLGVIRDVQWQKDTLRVTITPTYTGCPATSIIRLDIETALRARGLNDLELVDQISPPWTTDWISDAGRRDLAAYGIAPPEPSGGPKNCPRCGSENLSKISQFGSTPCKAQWRCDDCLEPFDYFKCI
jgi:ring-1,2-phenylacetyl-CoA epoxidase subunit PaaD